MVPSAVFSFRVNGIRLKDTNLGQQDCVHNHCNNTTQATEG
jgi:hypothetical protein